MILFPDILKLDENFRFSQAQCFESHFVSVLVLFKRGPQHRHGSLFFAHITEDDKVVYIHLDSRWWNTKSYCNKKGSDPVSSSALQM